jgi:hypothetical protein
MWSVLALLVCIRKTGGYGYTGARARTTQQSGQTPERKEKSATLFFVAVTTPKLIRLVCCLPTTSDCLAQQNRFVSSRQSGQTPAAVSIWFTGVGTVDQTYLIEHVRDLKPKFLDEIGELLKVCTNSTNVHNYLYKFYFRMLTLIINIYHILYT